MFDDAKTVEDIFKIIFKGFSLWETRVYNYQPYNKYFYSTLIILTEYLSKNNVF